MATDNTVAMRRRRRQRPARPRRAISRFWARLGLPAKLLLLTAVFVLIAETLIFLPSVASYRVTWLQERLTAAQLAALASDAFPGGQIPSGLRADLLRTAEVRAIASRREGERRLVLAPADDLTIDYVYYLQREPDSFWEGIGLKFEQVQDALATLFANNGRVIRVVGHSGPDNNDLIEIVIPEAPLRAAMMRYGLNILWLSIILSLLTAAVVYFALTWLFVKPLTRLTSNMLRFSEDPEDASRIMPLTGRVDEIGVAERELASMQRQLSGLLAQKTRLAQLGLAVSKINHDLRNMLANAQLISDRLVDIPDPTVQRFVPKLIATLDRAITFCNASLKFGRVTEEEPRRELMLLKPLVEEVADSQGLPREGSIAFVADMDASLRVDADHEHLFRALSNIVRNCDTSHRKHRRQDRRRNPRRRASRRSKGDHRCDRQRRRHSAEGARKSVQGVSRLDQKGRHGPRPRHRCRTCAGARRHTDACRRHEGRTFPHRAAGPFGYIDADYAFWRGQLRR